MLIHDLFGTSFRNLLLHKIRSMLTSLGVIFGVGSVIAMLSISEGAKRQSLAQIASMGIDKIIVYSKKPPISGKNEADASNSSMAEEYGLTEIDKNKIADMDNIKEIISIRDARKKILHGTTRVDLLLVGTQPGFMAESGSEIVDGRWITQVDMNNCANVCVIGRNVKRKLFSLCQTSLIGESIRIEDASFRIIGILENNRGTQFANINSPNDLIIIPSTTATARYGSYSMQREGNQYKIQHVDYDLLMVKILDISYIDDTSKRIAAYLTKTHQETKDWDMFVPLDLLKQREQTQNTFTIVMASIAGISLIVGGIGIMNIMLANVYERRKEIGTRMALGALRREILMQFLIETIFLTTMGGVIGVGLGIGISQTVTYLAEWPTHYSLWSIVLALFISMLTGIVFGTYPAWKAAQQNPITVLRAE